MILFRIFRDKLENSHTLDTFYLYDPVLNT